MKARINKDGKVVIGLPKYYANYAGNFDKQSDDVHKSFGFYPVVEPNYDPKRQRLGNLVFDADNEQFVYELVDINHNIDDIKEQLKSDLKLVMQEISGLVSEIKNIYDPLSITPENLPDEFKQKTQRIAPLHNSILSNIEALDDIDIALEFIVCNEEVEGFLENLRAFL